MGSTKPRQMRLPRVTYVRTRRSAFHASVASFFVRLADRCACGRTRSFRFCNVEERLRFRVTRTRRYSECEDYLIAIITPSHEFWNKFFVKWAKNQSLGEKWAATSKRLRSTGLKHSIWSLSRSWGANLTNVSESERGMSIFSESRSGGGVKNFRLRTPLVFTWQVQNTWQVLNAWPT